MNPLELPWSFQRVSKLLRDTNALPEAQMESCQPPYPPDRIEMGTNNQHACQKRTKEKNRANI